MPLVVHHKQYLFFADLLRSVAGWKFNIVTRGNHHQIDQCIPKLLGYHPHMETLDRAPIRKYILPPPDLSTITEITTVTDGMAYRYCVMSEYCPILLAKLLVMKNIVVLEIQDQEVIDFYKTCTLTRSSLMDLDLDLDLDLDNMSAPELRQLAEELYLAYTKLPCQLPSPPADMSDTGQEDEVPEDMREQGYTATVTTDKRGAQHLVLSPTDGPETLPEITIVTDLGSGTVTRIQQLLLHKCWLDNRYPVDKITWLVQSPCGRPDWWTWGGDRVQFQDQDHADQALYTVIWDLDFYYYPHSTYAKIKLMLDNPHIGCVGSSLVGGIDLRKTSGGYTF